MVFRRFISTVVAGIGLSSLAMAQQHFKFADIEIVAPPGWREISKTEDKLVLRPSDADQQATISLIQLGAPRPPDTPFDQFKIVCKLRIEGEKKELEDGFVESGTPFQDHDGFGMFFNGGDRKTGRIFIGYLSLVRRELVMIYVEGFGIDPKAQADIFKRLVTGLKRK
jgi:hypothetical protein